MMRVATRPPAMRARSNTFTVPAIDERASS